MRVLAVAVLLLLLGSTVVAEEPLTRISAETLKAVKKAALGDAKALAKIEKTGPLAKKAAADVEKKVLAGWRFRGAKGRETIDLDVEGKKRQYALAAPRGYSPKRSWPLIVSLHGAGGNGPGELGFIWGSTPGYRGFIAAPSGVPPGAQWFPDQVPFVLEMIRDVKRRANIDDDRVYVHGFSNGGNGAWYYAERYPGLFAAMCTRGGGNPMPAMLANLLQVPTYIVHGEDDPVIRVDSDRRDAKKLKEIGAEVVYTEVKNGGHSAFTNENEKILAFFAKHPREPWPKKLSFRTPGHDGTFRNLWLEVPARAGPQVEATVEGNVITLTGTTKATLWLSDALLDLDAEVVVKLGGTEAFRGIAARRLSTLVADLRERFDRKGAAWAKVDVGR